MSSWLSIDRRLRREVLGPRALVPCDSRSLMVTGGSSRHSTHLDSFWHGTLIMMGSGCVFEPGTVAYGHDRVALLLLFLDILMIESLKVSGRAVVVQSARIVSSQARRIRLSLGSDKPWSRPYASSAQSMKSAKGVVGKWMSKYENGSSLRNPGHMHRTTGEYARGHRGDPREMRHSTHIMLITWGRRARTSVGSHSISE